jgi:hypothetical protein
MGTPTLDHERTPRHARPVMFPKADEMEKDAPGSRKKKITISLSEKTMRALEELKRATDADTDSEVFRNAIRLHITLLRAHLAGVKLFMRRDGTEESVPVTLFSDGE